MADKKDAWDKFDILFKSLVLGLIPIVIGIAADNVAQSLQRGQLIQSLIESLSKGDARRDIALIALDESIPPYKKCGMLGIWRCENNLEGDPVIKISEVLINTSIETALKEKQVPVDLAVARQIISGEKRGSIEYYKKNFGDRIEGLKKSAQSRATSNPNAQPKSNQEIEEQANISQTIAAIQPSSDKPTVDSLANIRLVYIQYQNNKELAEKIQRDLQSISISAPGIEKVQGINQNDIRYADPTDRKNAEALQAYVQNKQSIKFSEPIDLSNAGYKVPLGQFEIWLK